jgi:hypothetical protein
VKVGSEELDDVLLIAVVGERGWNVLEELPFPEVIGEVVEISLVEFGTVVVEE